MASSSVPKTENHLLNSLRLVAALLVVAGHVRTTFFQDYAQEQPGLAKAFIFALTSLGNPAVLVFFTLSGYWVGGGALRGFKRGNFAFGDYLLRRLVRLWIVLIPALFLTLLVDKAGSALFPAADIYARPELYTGVEAPVSHNAAAFLRNVAFLQDFIVPAYGYDHPLWSLSYEFWYYIAFPCAILAFLPRQRWWVRIAALGGVAAALAIGGLQLLYLAPAWLLGAAAGAVPHAFDGVRGRLGPRRWDWCQLLAAVSIFVGMCAVRFMGGEVLPGLILGTITAMAIVVMAPDLSRPNRAVAMLSRASHCTYSLYTTHMPLIALLAALWMPNFGDRLHLLSVHGLILFAAILALLGFARIFAVFTEDRTEALRQAVSARLKRSPS